MPEDLRERLQRVATATWGEQWTLHTRTFTDGTVTHMVYHNHGRVDHPNAPEGSALRRDRLLVDDQDNIVHDRLVVTTETHLEHDVVERVVSE